VKCVHCGETIAALYWADHLARHFAGMVNGLADKMTRKPNRHADCKGYGPYCVSYKEQFNAVSDRGGSA